MSQPDYYALLHVAPDAPEAVIKASYRAVMQKLRAHPDLGGDPAQAALLNEALQVLLDSDQRRQYDQLRAESPATQAPQATAGDESDVAASADAPVSAGSAMPVAQIDAQVCAFCGHANRRPASTLAAYGLQSSRCGRCRAPTTPVASVAAVTQDGELRRLLRVTHDAEAQVRTQTDPTDWMAGRLRDFSVTGVSVILSHTLATGTCLHLRSEGIEAVASVVNSRRQDDGRYCLGLTCLSLVVELSPGTFVSSTC